MLSTVKNATLLVLLVGFMAAAGLVVGWGRDDAVPADDSDEDDMELDGYDEHLQQVGCGGRY